MLLLQSFPIKAQKIRVSTTKRVENAFSRSSSVGIRRIWHLTMQVAVVSLGRSLHHS